VAVALDGSDYSLLIRPKNSILGLAEGGLRGFLGMLEGGGW